LVIAANTSLAHLAGPLATKSVTFATFPNPLKIIN
jgi:hypothetical protein